MVPSSFSAGTMTERHGSESAPSADTSATWTGFQRESAASKSGSSHINRPSEAKSQNSSEMMVSSGRRSNYTDHLTEYACKQKGQMRPLPKLCYRQSS